MKNLKKVFVVLMSVMLLASAGTTVFADQFLNSVSGNLGPVVEEVKPDVEDTESVVVVTPYGERDTLPEEMKHQVEEAYTDIKEADDLTQMVTDLKEIADNSGIAYDKLAVSDLFTLHEDKKNEVDEDGYYTVTLSSDTFKNFAGLISYNGKSWELVKDVVVDGDKVTFRVKGSTTLAVVVDSSSSSNGGEGTTTGNQNKPGDNAAQTGDYAFVVAAVAVVAAAAVVCLEKSKRNAK